MILPRAVAEILGQALADAASTHASRMQAISGGSTAERDAKQSGDVLIVLAELTADLLRNWPDEAKS